MMLTRSQGIDVSANALLTLKYHKLIAFSVLVKSQSNVMRKRTDANPTSSILTFAKGRTTMTTMNLRANIPSMGMHMVRHSCLSLLVIRLNTFLGNWTRFVKLVYL